jgi:hypothetical protein
MKRATWWPIGIATVLATTVGANVALLYVSSGDPSLAIEPNYYAKAIAWDSSMAQSARNERLGWHIVPRLGAFTARDGAVLTVTVSDSTGAAIDDASVTVSALYNGRAAVVLEQTLEHADRAYHATLPVSHRGQWELRFDIRRGTERFTNTTRIEATERTGPAS